MQTKRTAVRQGGGGYCWHHQDQGMADVMVTVVDSPLHLIRHGLVHDDALDDASSTTHCWPHIKVKCSIHYTGIWLRIFYEGKFIMLNKKHGRCSSSCTMPMNPQAGIPHVAQTLCMSLTATFPATSYPYNSAGSNKQCCLITEAQMTS